VTGRIRPPHETGGWHGSHELNRTEGERFTVVPFVLLGDMHDQHAVTLPADQAARSPPLLERQQHAPTLQAAQARNQFRITRAALTGANPFYIVQYRDETPCDFSSSPVTEGDVVHVKMPVAPKPTGQTIAFFDRGRIDHGAAPGHEPRVGRSSHGCQSQSALLTIGRKRKLERKALGQIWQDNEWGLRALPREP